MDHRATGTAAAAQIGREPTANAASPEVLNEIFNLTLINWHSWLWSIWEQMRDPLQCDPLLVCIELTRNAEFFSSEVMWWGGSTRPALGGAEPHWDCHIKVVTSCLKQVLHLVFWVLSSLDNQALVAYYCCSQVCHNKWWRRKLSSPSKPCVILRSSVASGLAAFQAWCWSRTLETIAYCQ